MVIAVSIVEDDAGIRENLRKLIDGAEGFTVRGVYASGEEALKGIPRDPPDVALMDLNLPSISGVECIRKLKIALPKLNVVVFTVFEDNEKLFSALKAGACGYLIKRTPPEKVLSGIRDVFEGGSAMSSFIARKVVQSFYETESSNPELARLSAREEETLKLAAKGFHNKDIATELKISTETVRVHLRNIYEKLQVSSRSQAVVKYLNHS
jgi:DNA-binding NarL/FixJ family response regulator